MSFFSLSPQSNVEGRTCGKCVGGTFGLSVDNPTGCTSCYCFRRTDQCTQADLTWSQVGTVSGLIVGRGLLEVWWLCGFIEDFFFIRLILGNGSVEKMADVIMLTSVICYIRLICGIHLRTKYAERKWGMKWICVLLRSRTILLRNRMLLRKEDISEKTQVGRRA